MHAHLHTHMCPHTHTCTCREEIKFCVREIGTVKLIVELRVSLTIRHNMEVFRDPWVMRVQETVNKQNRREHVHMPSLFVRPTVFRVEHGLSIGKRLLRRIPFTCSPLVGSRQDHRVLLKHACMPLVANFTSCLTGAYKHSLFFLSYSKKRT